jgi:hypothetical protein
MSQRISDLDWFFGTTYTREKGMRFGTWNIRILRGHVDCNWQEQLQIAEENIWT